MIGYQLVVIEDGSLPVILLIHSKKFKPMVYGVFVNKKGVFLQKCDKRFKDLRKQLSVDNFNDNFCSP